MSKMYRSATTTLVSMLCSTLVLVSCVNTEQFRRDDVTAYSALIKQRGERRSLVTRISLRGQESDGDIRLGDSIHYASAGKFTLSVVEASYGSGSVSSPTDLCADQFGERDFSSVMASLLAYLGTPETIDEIRFEIIPIPTNVRYRSKTTTRIEDMLPIRLAFGIPGDVSQCRSWWIHVLGTLIHEYTHAHLALEHIESPNLMSEEVIAYSMMPCALLAFAGPDELHINTFNLPDPNIPFDEIRSLILSTPGISDGAYGQGLAELNIFHLLDRSIEHTLKDEQRLNLGDYCRTVATGTIDFKKQSYFDIVDEPDKN